MTDPAVRRRSRLLLKLKNLFAYRLRDASREPLQRRFSDVYREGWWTGPRGALPVSGPGSSLENTAGVRAELLEMIGAVVEGPTVSLADVPCGDLTWMPELLARLAERYAEVDYRGFDIVPALIEAARATPAPAPGVRMSFAVADLTREPPPPVDVVLCKDLVNHLFDRDVFAVLDNLNNSGARYAAITSNRGCTNRELELKSPGSSRFLDLEAWPFCLPATVGGNDYLGLWRLPFEGWDGGARRG